MIVVMEPDASDAAIESVISFLVAAGFDVHRSSGQSRSILGVVGDVSANDISVVSEFEAVAQQRAEFEAVQRVPFFPYTGRGQSPGRLAIAPHVKMFA